MKEKKIDILISACNTSSMYLDQIDLKRYPFKIISLFEVMKNFFINNSFIGQIALMATSANIDSKRYLEWSVSIVPIKCPTLVPLIEAGKINEAIYDFIDYLKSLPREVSTVIIGCTHYAFLYDKLSDEYRSRYSFIDPAKLVVQYLEHNLPDTLSPSLPLEPSLEISDSAFMKVDFYASKNYDFFIQMAKTLLLK